MSDRIAVMSAGRIAQCGPPEEIYEHPAEEFVAGFIGISNLIEGVVEGGGEVRIATGKRVPAPVPSDCSRGDTVQLSVRPEKIAVDEEIEEGMVRLEGTIEGRVYLGVSTQITVALGDGARLRAAARSLSFLLGRFPFTPPPGVTVRRSGASASGSKPGSCSRGRLRPCRFSMRRK